MMPSGIDGPAPPRVLVLGDPEQQDGGNAEIGEPAALLGGAVGRELRNAWHGVDGLLDASARDDEERLHELLQGHPRLAHQAAEGIAAPQPPRAVSGVAAHRTPRLRRSPAGLQK